MNKTYRQGLSTSAIASAVAVKMGLSSSQAQTAVNATIDIIKATVGGGGKVTLRGLGSFVLVDRKARKARNPRTNTEIAVPAKMVIKFKPSKGFKV